jgi:hypothetical protein
VKPPSPKLHLGVRARLVAVSGAACMLAACASIFGIDEPDVDLGFDSGASDGTVVGEGATSDGGASDALDGSAVQDGSSEAAPDATPDGFSMDVFVPDASVCGLVPDATMGVFVAPNGADNSACGSSLAPCLTIQYGISRANGKPNVYVASGSYAESILLTPGTTVWGGWSVEVGDGGDVWTGICAPANPIGAVTIQPTTSNVTVTANMSGAPVGLKTLTILSKPQANVTAGESLYGVFATGAANLTLDNVDVTVGNGGDGTSGYTAGGGIEGNPVCNPGDGGPGAPGGPDGGGAAVGSFTEGGYQPAAGDTGGLGVAGSSGRPDDAGTCVGCVSCTAVAIVGCQSAANGMSCGGPGGSGCGGGGGNGGGPGGGAGSSIGVFVWGATVTAAGGTIEAGNGGQGGIGGSGGAGGAGGTGTTGQNGTSCTVDCNIVGVEVTCPSSTSGAGQGSVGTTGGSGSRGGAGGGGAGGWSCAILQGTGASVAYSAVLVHHNSGSSPGGGASGMSGDTCAP